MSDAPSSEIVHGDLTLARFAELSALARLASPPFQDSLAARGMSEEDWAAARAAWNRAIEAELERGDDRLVVAFAEALAEAKERLRREPPETGSRRESVPPSSAPAPFPLPSAARVSPPERLSILEAPPNPAFFQASAQVAPPSHVAGPAQVVPPSHVAGPAQVASPSHVAGPAPVASPSHVAAPASVVASVVVPPLLRGEESPRLDVTAKLPMQEIIARILPFQPAPSSPASPPAAVASSPGASSSVASSPGAGPAGPPEPVKLKPVSSSLGGTADLVMPRVLPKPLPFAARTASSLAASPAPAASAASPAPAASAAPSPPAAPGQAASTRTAAPQPVPAASPAPRAATAAPIPRLTPEQYASLTAELAVRPHRADEVRARYFVANEPAWDALQSEWQQRMNADPRLKQRIAELVAHYRTWLESAGGGPKDR